ncbi:MAG: hypothetical protein BGO38_09795 [Cellulomonas sp. 73-145]|uniref:hypothetical protein n=1 Tax=Cellulomonas sp. 73-145 TaxID=1895739 RepID=UPI000928CB99|nr:hypothetical protein [Cellulomonas sp. 73-145]OJV60992.1 MAG: hypothetical protein BGO38_09795 [Cellulomonas sp. 73-145]
MRATYGDLVGRAGVDIHTGLLQVMRRGFHDPTQAQNTVGTYYDLLAALRNHAWWLLDPAKARSADLPPQGRGRPDHDDLDRVAANLFASLGPLTQRPVQMPYPEPTFDHPWRDAADKLGAATDLLATHVGPRYEPRSEQAALVLDLEQRHGALAFIAALTDLTLNADSAIGAACRHRDIPWEQVNQWLPDRSTTKALTHRMHQLASQHDQGRGLRDVTTNIYPVREGDPVVELGDRMLRLRHAAWQLAAATPDYSVVTLHDLAGLGMAAHMHTAHAHGIDYREPSTSPNRLVATARAFQRLMVDLDDYLAPGPPNPAIRVDILAVRQIVAEIVPLHRPARALTISDPQTRNTLEALHGTCEALGQIAHMNQTVFATLSRSELLHVPTRLLDGETLSEDPIATAAKLTGARRILAPMARVRETVQRYEAVDAATGHIAPYVAPVARATAYEPPALYRPAEFEGRP